MQRDWERVGAFSPSSTTETGATERKCCCWCCQKSARCDDGWIWLGWLYGVGNVLTTQGFCDSRITHYFDPGWPPLALHCQVFPGSPGIYNMIFPVPKTGPSDCFGRFLHNFLGISLNFPLRYVPTIYIRFLLELSSIWIGIRCPNVGIGWYMYFDVIFYCQKGRFIKK